MRHFKTRKEANKFKDEKNKNFSSGVKVFKKIKGMKNRIKKPFLVGSYIEWLNQY